MDREYVIDDTKLEKLVTSAMKMGTIVTLKELGLLSEIITKSQAENTYSKRLIKEWRSKGWITGYPSGNSKRAGVYFKRSELEIASAMLDIRNILPENKIFNRDSRL